MQSECAECSNTGACSSEVAAQARPRPLGASLGGGRGGRIPLAEACRVSIAARVDEHIRRHRLLEPEQPVVCLVSGGADSTCLFHVLRELGYRVSALHVDHGLRGAESDEDAQWCAAQFDAE